MPKISKRDALDVLAKPRLLELAQGFELEASAGQLKAEVLDALARSKRASYDKVLGLLTRNELKAICVSHGLDDSGREKQVLVGRILGQEAAGQMLPPKTAPTPKALPGAKTPPRLRGRTEAAETEEPVQAEPGKRTKAPDTDRG